MLQQMLLFCVHMMLDWMWSWSLPHAVWVMLGQGSRGLATLIQFTPAFPYAPYDVLALGLKAWVSVYSVLLVLSFVSFIFEWIRGK